MKSSKALNLLLVLALITFACKKDYNAEFSQQDQQIKIKPVAVQQLEVTSEPIPIEASGILGSKSKVNLSFKIGGIVQRIYVEEGQSVRAGQLLATLNLSEINAQVNRAKNAMIKAERDLNRARNLYRDSVITLEQLQDLTTLFEVSKSDLEIAEFNQEYAKITAPANGKVLRRFVETGELVNGGTPIFVVGNTAKDAFIMRIGIADKDIIKLEYADTANVKFDVYPEVDFHARVTEIAESADARTGAFEVELTLDPSYYKLKNGFVGKVKIFPSNQEPHFRISMNALVAGGQESAQVFVLKEPENRVEKVKVAPRHIDNEFFTVLASDLNNGSVVTEGAAYLADGDQVRVVDQIANN